MNLDKMAQEIADGWGEEMVWGTPEALAEEIRAALQTVTDEAHGHGYDEGSQEQAERVRVLEDWIVDYGWRWESDEYDLESWPECMCGEKMKKDEKELCLNVYCLRGQIQEARATDGE